MKRCYYEVLGIDRSATDSQIKSAYRKVALKFHPDRNPSHDAEENFKEASEAYEVLNDPEKRAIYDQFGHRGLDRQGFHGFTDVGDIFSHFSDIFDEFFGMESRSGRSSGRGHGRDLRFDMEISFMEAYRGAEKGFEIQRQESCGTCRGKGYPPDVEPTPCIHCGGSGQLYHNQGFFTISTACAACRGQGRVLEKHCETCRGSGFSLLKKNLKVKVPPGVDHGTQLILRGEGEGGRQGGSSGDLYVVLHMENHPRLRRQGNDLILDQKVSMVQASLGEEIGVETPEGEAKLRIPPGAQTGDILKIAGKGMPRLHGKDSGDLLIQLFVATPKNLTKEQRELLQAFEEASSAKDPKKKSESFFTKSPKHSKKSKFSI